MGATIFAFLMLIILVIGGIIFAVRSIVKNKNIKYVLKLLIIIILSLPVSWISFLIYGNITNIFEDLLPPHDFKHFLYSYFIIINILGIVGYILYLKFGKKIDDKYKIINKLLMFILHLNILCDVFPIILLFTE